MTALRLQQLSKQILICRMDPITKQDLKDVTTELKQWMLEREVASIRWFVGTQMAYVVITLGAMYFMLQRIH
jgi:hypothetical protein